MILIIIITVIVHLLIVAVSGVSIVIPPGAIPDGVRQEIYFKVCQDNSIMPPLDKEKGNVLCIGIQSRAVQMNLH